MRHRIAGTLLVATLAACGGATLPVANRAALAAVTDRFNAWVKAVSLHRPDALTPFYIQAEHLVVHWPNGQSNRGWSQESEFQRTFLPTVTVMNLVPQSPRVVLVRSNLALVGFQFTLDLSAGGSRQIGPGQGMMLWQYGDGAWRIYAAQLSYIRAVEAQMR